MIELKTHPSYDPVKTANFFAGRGWEVSFTHVRNIDLIIPHRGSAIECFDGRHANRRVLEKVEIEGPKIPGGINGVMALKTGGCPIGFNVAAQEAGKLKFNVGTHKKCAFFDIWRNGELTSAKYPLLLPKSCTDGVVDLGYWLRLKIRHLGGKHFHLPGEHKEEGLMFNPFNGTTLISRNDRFTYDHWLMQLLDIKGSDAYFLAAETVEKLKPESMKVEFLYH